MKASLAYSKEVRAMNKKLTYKLLFGYVNRQRFFVIASLLFALSSVAVSLYIPVLTGEAIDLIIGRGEVDFKALGEKLLFIGICIGVTALSQWLMNVCNNHICYKIVHDIRHDAFARLEILPLRFFDGHEKGDIVSRLIADVDQLSDGLLMGFSQAFTGIITIAITLFYMLRLKPLVALIVIILTPLSLFVARFVAKHTYDMFQLQSKTRGEQTSLIDETISNQKAVDAYLCQNKQLEKFDEINERLRSCSLRAVFFSSLVNPSTRFINSLVYAGVGVFGAFFTISGGMTVGQLSAFLSYANQYTKPFNEISGVITELQNAFACATRVFEIISAEPETDDSGNTVLSPSGSSSASEVEFDHIAFSYKPERPLIKDFSLSVKPGMRIAIVGPTGCGKTTLINLIMRFYDVNSGEIKVYGEPVTSVTRQSLRQCIGMVLQETWVRAGTIRDNIALAKPDATDEEITEAAKAAHAHSFIRRLPNGYDTVITEDGGGLSQGQKQLLCISRLMLKLPPILILDEATSSIDTRTEIQIQKAFAAMMQGRTSFIVAHRLSTIKSSDLILVMKDGDIIERGNHEELVKKGGLYTTLYNSQF